MVSSKDRKEETSQNPRSGRTSLQKLGGKECIFRYVKAETAFLITTNGKEKFSGAPGWLSWWSMRLMVSESLSMSPILGVEKT